MSTTEVTSPRISFELCAIQPPEHPTYDLKGIIKLALSEDAGDLGFLAHIRWSGVKTMEISSIKGYSLEKFKGKVSEEVVVVVKILAEDCPNQGIAIRLEINGVNKNTKIQVELGLNLYHDRYMMFVLSNKIYLCSYDLTVDGNGCIPFDSGSNYVSDDAS
ncbi:hypothetical protein Fmac_028198 [Flemingia macrophylla]|uniref:Uncharacterized protein n=1 Tax=Flemingia macrophylla TaxID=520843 RepID=A0ABD1L6T7_9FABA